MPKPPTGEPVCPTCGRDDFASERGLKSHHSRAHGEKLGMVTVDCANCGVEMERERSQIKDNEFTYCSQDCVNEHKQDRYSGDGNPRSTLESVDCANCGAELQRPRWRRELEDRFFCDMECMGEYRAGEYLKEGNPRWKEYPSVECEFCGKPYKIVPAHEDRTRFCSNGCFYSWQSEEYAGKGSAVWRDFPTKVCETCGEEYTVKPSLADDSRYCSYDCMHESAHPSGENHPRWNPDSQRLYYGANWSEQRHKAIIRDQARCQIDGCPSTEADQVHEMGRGIDVHHITPLKEFEGGGGEIDHGEANGLANLITVCRWCHQKVESDSSPLQV